MFVFIVKKVTFTLFRLIEAAAGVFVFDVPVLVIVVVFKVVIFANFRSQRYMFLFLGVTTVYRHSKVSACIQASLSTSLMRAVAQWVVRIMIRDFAEVFFCLLRNSDRF